MLELRVLGTLDLREGAGGRPVMAVLAQPKRTALLACLCVATPRGPHLRESLFLLFWPNSTQERARNSLNQAVFNLRRNLGETVIFGAGEELRVDPQLVWCDAVAFDEALSRGDKREAVALYGGDLLPGFHLDDCIEFEHWLDGERERLRSRAVAAALDVAAEDECAGNGVAAADVLRRAVSWAPLDDSAAERLIRLLARLGDRTGAVREYERLRSRLDSDLSLEPSAGLTTLVEQLRAGAARVDPRAGAPSSQPVYAEASPAGAVRPSPDGSPERATFATATTTARPPRSALRRRIAALSAAALVVAIAAIASVRVARSSPAEDLPPLDRQRVLVAAFENRTGDRALEPITYMAADWIAQGLARTGVARVVPLSTIVQETPHLSAEGSAPEVAVPTANRQLARRLGAAILVGGSYYRAGDSLVVQAQVIDVRTGELLRAIEEVRGSPERPAAAMEELQRRALGAVATLLDARLESWPDPGGQPSSLEAYRLFSDGMSSFMQAMAGDWGSPQKDSLFTAAAGRFEAANLADSSFVLPLLWAAYAHTNSNNVPATGAIVRRLESRNLSAWNRAVLDHLAAGFANDEEATYQAARQLAELSPDSEWLWKLANAAMRSGRAREAQRVFARIDPNRGWIKGSGSFWRLRVEPHHVLGDYRRALDDVRRGLQEHPDDVWLRNQELFALAALGRGEELAGMLRPQLAADDPSSLWRLNIALEELHGHGRRAALRRLARETLPIAESLAYRRSSPVVRGEFARTLELMGQPERAAVVYDELLREQPNNAQFRVRSAILAARVGDRRQAAETLQWLSTLSGEQLARTFPQPQRGYWGSPEGWLALLQVRLLVQLGDGERAVEMVEHAMEKGLAHAYLHLHDDPDFDPLRRHPGFQRLLRPRG